MAAAVRGALENRTDLQESQRQIASNDVSLRTHVAIRQLPALDLSASYGVAGARRHAVHPSGQRPRQHDHRHHSRRLWRRAADPRRSDYPTWNFQVNLIYPIGTSPADANYARARVQQRQTIAQRRVSSSSRSPPTSRMRRCRSRSNSRALCRRRSRRGSWPRSASRRSRAGSTSACRRTSSSSRRSAICATAQNSELRALLDYRRALVDFERVQEVPAGRWRRHHGDQRGRRWRRSTRRWWRSVRRRRTRLNENACRHRRRARRGACRRRDVYGRAAAATRPQAAAAAGARPRWRRRRRELRRRAVAAAATRPPMTVEIGTAHRGSIMQQLVVVGNLVGDATVAVVPRAAGRLQDISVRLGDRVSRGPAHRQDRGLRAPGAGQAAGSGARSLARHDPAARGGPQARRDQRRTVAQPVRAPAAARSRRSTTPRRATSRRSRSSISRARRTTSRPRGSTSCASTSQNTVIVSPVNGFVARRAVDPGRVRRPERAGRRRRRHRPRPARRQRRREGPRSAADRRRRRRSKWTPSPARCSWAASRASRRCSTRRHARRRSRSRFRTRASG